MRKIMTNTFLVLLCLGIIGCTEQIAEEVKNSESLSESDTDGTAEYDKAIRVVNTMDSSLSYILHKSGAFDEACELNAPSEGFSSLNYDKSSASYTADCIIDAQEYDLYFSGAEFEVQVDGQLCEYVGYKPFRFFNNVPGKSTRKEYEWDCDTQCKLDWPSKCGTKYNTSDFSQFTYNAGTDEYTLDPTKIALARTSQITDPDGLTCKFDYSKDEPIAGPNCDEGTIKTYKASLSSVSIPGECQGNLAMGGQTACEADNPANTWIATHMSCANDTISATDYFPKVTFTDSEFKCGGKLSACLAGPGSDLLDEDQTTIVTQNLETEVFKKKIEIEAPSKKGYFSNMYIANFSRICSSTENKTNAQFDTTINTILGHQVEDMPSRYEYEGFSVDEDTNGNDDFTVLADHPFKGKAYFSDPTRNVQPYYAIVCMDQARDVKAQIRIFIRDWDREFDLENPYLGLVSDVNQSEPLMDSNGDQLAGEVWNDRADWDDLFGDYDMRTSEDYNGDGNKLDKLFTNNSCKFLDYGQCSNPLYTEEETCLLNSHRWIIGHCSDPNFTNEIACQGASETWNPNWIAFPSVRL